MELLPTRGKVFIKPLEKQEVRASGFLMPDKAEESILKGTILAIGNNRYEFGQEIPGELNVGDLILYGKFVGNEIIENGENFKIINESDVLAVISKSTEGETE